MQNILRIAIVIMTCLAVGYLSSIVTQENIPTWYANINKPSFNPPNWIFAPVWTTLYVLMGYAGGRIWNKIGINEAAVKKAFLFYSLSFNGL